MEQNDTKWKQKYLTALDKFEKKERGWTDLEEMLRLGMTRVALAAQGVDDKLDKQLNSLRKSIRSGSYNGLEYIVEEISQSVKRLDEQRSENNNDDNNLPAALLQFIDTLTFPGPLKKQVGTLQKQLRNTAADQPVDDALRQLATLINSTLSIQTATGAEPPAAPLPGSAAAAPGKSLLGKLFGAATPNAPTAEPSATGALSLAASILKQLLQGLRQAAEHKEPVDQLDQQLAQATSESGLYAITASLGQLISASLKNSRTPAAVASSPTAPEDGVTDNSTDNVADNAADQATTAQHHAAASLTDTTQNPQEQSPPVTPSSAPHNATGASHTPAFDQQQSVIAGFCLNLLEQLQLPHDFDEDVQNLRDKIVGSTQASESAAIINEIADLITATRARVEREKQDLQDFLRQLTDRLKDIDEHLAGAETSSKASFTSRKVLGDAVEVQMKSIETTVEDAPESGQLKQIVRQHLDTIRDHVIKYQQGEESNQRVLLDELSKSNMRLQELEQETEQLRARLSEEHAQALHDRLTGIYNRLAYEERIEQEYQRFKRYKKPLVLLVYDVDHFKSINDTYGHRAGDKALRLIAQTLQKNLRATDFLARYGGEEFVILMPETDISDAMVVADKLREAVHEVKFNYQQQEVSITVSCGASQFGKGDTAGQVFQRADKSLYHAKQNGRNQCHTDDV